MRTSVLTLSVLAAAALTLGAGGCDDVYADLRSFQRPPAFADAGAVFPVDFPTTCPTSRPRENTACAAIGSSCEYGDSPDPLCNTVLTCRGASNDGHWAPRPREGCHEGMCPAGASMASLDGTPCAIDSDAGPASDAEEAVCNVTDGVCACTTGRDGASAHPRKWVCVRPLAVCPPSRPLAGQPCEGSLWCDYGSCAFKRGVLMECIENVWLSGGASCP